MDFAFTSDEDAFGRELRRFAERDLAPHYQNDDKIGQLHPGVFPAMARMGLTGLRIPAENGGQNAGAVAAGLAALAKLWVPKLAGDVIHQCLLTFGHTAYPTESPIGQRLRDVIGLEIGDGTAQACSLVVAPHLPGREFAP